MYVELIVHAAGNAYSCVYNRLKLFIQHEFTYIYIL